MSCIALSSIGYVYVNHFSPSSDNSSIFFYIFWNTEPAIKKGDIAVKTIYQILFVPKT